MPGKDRASPKIYVGFLHMPDTADSANETMEIELAASLSVQRNHAAKIAKERREYEEKLLEKNLAAGVCLNCKDEIQKGTLYCPPLPDQDGNVVKGKKSECQTDHEKRIAKRGATWA